MLRRPSQPYRDQTRGYPSEIVTSSTPVPGCAWDTAVFVAIIQGDVVINEKQPYNPEHEQGLMKADHALHVLHVLCPVFSSIA